MKKIIKIICIGMVFLPMVTSQKSMAEPTVICCLENPWRKCAVVVYFDSDGNQVNFNVANGTEVRCPSYM